MVPQSLTLIFFLFFQFGWLPMLDEFTRVHNNNSIEVSDSLQPVSNSDDCALFQHSEDNIQYASFRGSTNGAGHFVDN